MLVISRKKGESILIGDNIELTIVKLDDGMAKIAIDAPKSINILRKELYVEIEEENKKAANLNMSILKKIKEK